MNETKESSALRDIFHRLVFNFTSHHDTLEVIAQQSGDLVTLITLAHSEDASKIVGSGGANFNALVFIMKTAAAKLGIRVYVARIKNIEWTFKPERQSGFKALPGWPQREIEEIFKTTCESIFAQPFDFEWTHHKQPSDELSTIDLSISPEEQLPLPDEAIGDGLSIIFNCIGMSKGRKLRVHLTRKVRNESDPTNRRTYALSR